MKKLILFVLTAALLWGCGGREEQVIPEYVLTYAENQPEDYPTTLGAEYFAQLVKERTGGRIVIQVLCDAQMGTQQEVLDQLAFGGVDFSRPLMLGYTGLSDALLEKYVLDSGALWDGHGDCIRSTPISSVIGTHAGPGAIAVAFFKQ